MIDEKKKIRIIHLTTDSAIGGTERMILQTVRGLDKNRFESIVAALIAGGPLGKICVQENILFYTPCFKSKFDFFAVIRLFRYLKKSKADILHTYLFHANILGRVLGRMAGIKVIISSQRNVDLWRKRYHNFVDKATSWLCSVIVSNSISGKNFLVEKTGIEEKKIRVIHNGLELEKYPVSKNETGVVNIVNVASLTEKKGHIYLFKGISKLLDLNADFKLFLIGAGKKESYLKSVSREMGLQDKVFFEGYRDDVISYLKQTDIFVLPSLWEGTPVALMEAMACATACIATDVGDVKELISNGHEGIIIEPKNVDQITNSILRLINDKMLRHRLGANARKKIQSRFSAKKMVYEFEMLYLECMHGGGLN